jgi:hypothetical protein
MAKPNLRLSFVKKYRDRHGKMRFYYRPTGVAFPGLPGSREFMAASSHFDGERHHTHFVKLEPAVVVGQVCGARRQLIKCSRGGVNLIQPLT